MKKIPPFLGEKITHKGKFMKEQDYLSSSYGNNNIESYLPEVLKKIVNITDSIVQVDKDTIVVALLTVLASLSYATTYALNQYEREEDSIIIYAACFQPTGIGKSSVISFLRKHLLLWQEADKAIEKIAQKEQIAILKQVLDSCKEKDKQLAIKQQISKLESNHFLDFFLDDATSEGLEDSLKINSSPHIFLDEFGKYLKSSEKDEHKKSYLTALQKIFDNGFFATKKLRNTETSIVHVKNLGVFFASTINDSNLTNKQIVDLIADGFLNRALCTFYMGDVPKPLKIQRGIDLNTKEYFEKFARSYHEYAKHKHFYFSKDAILAYTDFLHDINQIRTAQILNNDDRAGLTVRLLKITTRIAVIFHIAIHCIHNTFLEEIDAETMVKAIGIVEYLRINHCNYILDIARTSKGRLTLEEKCYLNIQKYNKKYGGMPKKNLCANMRLYGAEFSKVETILLQQKKIEIKEGLYYGL